MLKIEFTNEQIQEMIKLYEEDNLSLSKIANKFNVSRGVISRVFKENTDKVTIRQRTHKYKADYNKFENIDSAEKAYWLGFLAADGCVYTRENNASIIINIHNKDKEHLEKFKKFMNSNAEIIEHIQNDGFSNNTPMVKFVLNSKKMAQDLIDKGVVQRKSLILNKPKINEEFYLPYILGYFDGDGALYQSKTNKEFYFSLQGTKEILEWILKTLDITLKLEKRINDNKNSYYIRCGGLNKPYNLLNKLYNSVNVHLNRKFEIYQALETVVLNGNIK